MIVFKSFILALLTLFFLKFIYSSRNDEKNIYDCFMCPQNIPTCHSCGADEFCYITRRSCYQCSQAICAKSEFREKWKPCNPHKKHVCHCSNYETCLLTVRNRVNCPKTICIDLVGPKIKFLKDYFTLTE